MYFILVTALGLMAAALGLWAIIKIVEKNDRIEVLERRLEDTVEAEAIAWAAVGRSSEAYRSLEQGMDEEQENYEQQFLSHQEIIARQIERIEYLVLVNGMLKDQVDYHDEHCLPDLATMRLMSALEV